MKAYLHQLITDSAKRVEYLSGFEVPNHLIERPKDATHGDYASNIGLAAARLARRAPQSIAQDIVEGLHPDPTRIESVEVVPPGFINFRVTQEWLWKSLRQMRAQGDAFGRSDYGGGQKVQIEFVSANPTGPLNVVSARAAAVGDALANLLRTVGYDVSKEYYVNDAGKQIDLLVQSVDAAYQRLLGHDVELPEEGYRGSYIEETAKAIYNDAGESLSNVKNSDRRNKFRDIVLKKILHGQRETLRQFGLVYDTWFSERSLHESGVLNRVLEQLFQSAYVFQQDGATWFRSSQFGDEKDRVLITSEAQPTYLLGDIAYHQNKFERGYQWVIDLWGPDHHGHIPRMKAAMEALGYDPNALELKIVQQVNLLQGGEKAKMSKREGRLVSMTELIDEVGVDAARFFFLMRKTSAHLDFDLDLAKAQSDENPVYYVQYAHARICSILRHTEESGEARPPMDKTDVSLLHAAEEIALIKKLLIYPEVVESCARNLEPHGLTTYLQEVAGTFHPFYHRHRVLTDDVALAAARIYLIEAVRNVLRNGLLLLGISAPEKM